jgi:Zn/Cd-binding protein ZinT
MKTYSAQSGYVYQYYYDGYRPFRSAGESGVEFVFTVSADRKSWNSVSVQVSDQAVAPWESSHTRTLSNNERYAIGKMALFQAFDDRANPASMKEAVRVRPADVDAIAETLDL